MATSYINLEFRIDTESELYKYYEDNYRYPITEIEKDLDDIFYNLLNQKRKSLNSWKIAEDGDGIVCPHCGEDFCVMINETDRFNFCPNCGKEVSHENNR